MKPISALYYLKENKGRSFIIIFMLLLTTFLFLAGNYVESIYFYWEKAIDYSDKFVKINSISTDEDLSDFTAFYEDISNDDRLIVLPKKGKGFGGISWITTLGFEMGSASMNFNSVEDLQTTFDHLGISCDYSDLKDGSVVMSSAYAAQYDLKKGDVLDSSVSDEIEGEFTLDAIIEDDSYIMFYVKEYSGVPIGANVIGVDMEGQELRDYLKEIQGDRKLQIDKPLRDKVNDKIRPFTIIFLAAITLISLVLSVVVNSVITGQYIRRIYEFGVYRAIGISRFEIFRKCASEIVLMDVIACVSGALIIGLLMFLLNELIYKPTGKFLPYYSELGLVAFAIANLLVVIPTVILKGRGMSRTDVTEF